MHLAVVHDRINESDAPDTVDVLHQAETVETALEALGHTSVRLDCSLDLGQVRRRIETSGAVMVVNLVESIEGKGRLIHLFPTLLEAIGIPCTGAGAEVMLLTSNKLLAKKWMSAAGIPTPPWSTATGVTEPANSTPSVWIVKSIWEHASIGLDENSIVKTADAKEIIAILNARSDKSSASAKKDGVSGPAAQPPSRPASSLFAEAFVEGREFNLSILAGEAGPEVLPPAEIIFEGYSPEMPKIVDYRAKWDETAYAYHHTPRTFDFGADDRPLMETLKKLALDCWKCFDLTGYARVDFRVDKNGDPWVLEVNANPCLSPDAGFAAALRRAGISFEAAVGRILGDV
jgi:D-alanine-D-alanine ligase